MNIKTLIKCLPLQTNPKKYEQFVKGLDYKKLECVCKHYKINMTKPWKSLTEKQQQMVLYGSDEIIQFKYQSKSGNQYNSKTPAVSYVELDLTGKTGDYVLSVTASMV